MAKTNIGRVSVVPKGEYSSTENYKRLDVVSDNGSMYISKKDNNQGNPLTDKNWWFKAVEKGEVGPQGEKPVNGVDYNTPEEKEEFKNDVVNKATEEVEKNIADIEDKAIKNYNENATQKTNEYDTNADTKLKAYNDNTTTKSKEYNDNATSKVSEYNTNATTQTETFNTNASTKTTEFDTNAINKTNAFNENYDEKLADINEASTSIEQERVISDGKYAKALKTPVTDVESTQIYAENDSVSDLTIKGAELTQVVTDNSPSLDNPSEVQVASEQNIQISNENLIYIDNAEYIEGYTVSKNGVTFTVQSDLSLKCEGTATENTNIQIITRASNAKKVIIKNITGKLYPYIVGNSISGARIVAHTIDRTYISIVNTGFNLSSDLFFDNVYAEIVAGSTVDCVIYPQLTYEKIDKYVEPQKGNIITIPLVNSSIGQYADTIDRENNVQNKVIQELIFTGADDENWVLWETKEKTQIFSILKTYNLYVANNSCVKCNYFINQAGDVEKFSIGDKIYIAVNKTRANTVEEFRNLLAQLNASGNPLKFYVVKKEITPIPLSEEVKQELDKFKLYNNLNNVFIDKSSLSFKYNKSLSKELEEKDEMIDNLLTRVQALEQAQVNQVGGN